MKKRISSVLFIGTGNSVRSILAESILNCEFGDRFLGFSAGEAPTGNVHPVALNLLKTKGHDTSYLRSKSWREFATFDALRFDFAFTLSEQALQERHPLWNGRPITAHWGFPDPAAVNGTESDQFAAFECVYRLIYDSISKFVSLQLSASDDNCLKSQVREIGREMAFS